MVHSFPTRRSSDLPLDIRNVIQQQYIVVQASHDRIRDLRDRFEK